MSEIEVFDSLMDVPLDGQDPADDGDDSTVPGKQRIEYSPPMALRLSEDMLAGAMISQVERRVVPFFPSKPGSRGKRVIALKRALARCPKPNSTHNYLHWYGLKFSEIWGVRTTEAMKAWSKDHGFSATAGYTREKHAKMARFYDSYAISLLLDIPVVSKDDVLRGRFLAELMWLYSNRYSIRYSQARPFDLRKPPWALDCSGTGEWVARQIGMTSLSGYSGFGYGNTDTQLARYKAKGWLRDSVRNSKTGDPRYYGSGGDPSHVSFYIGHSDGVARCASFGSYPLKILDIAYRHDGIADCNLTGAP